MPNLLRIILSIWILFTLSPAYSQCISQDATGAAVNISQVGQSFTIPASGCGTILSSIELSNSAGTLFDVTLTIYEGETNSGASKYVQTITIPNGYNVIELMGGSGTLDVTPGSQYSFKLEGLPGSGITHLRTSVTNPYAGGVFFANDGNPYSCCDLTFRINALSPDIQCISQDAIGASISISQVGQSFTIPESGCGTTLKSIELRNSVSTLFNVTLTIYEGETNSGVSKYVQTGIDIPNGYNAIPLSGGTGTLDVVPGNQYSFKLEGLPNGSSHLLSDAADPYPGGGYFADDEMLYNCCDLAFRVNTAAIILPVELVEFKGFASPSGNRLVWITATEVNNKGFQLERSGDGINWEAINFIGGQGTTQQSHTYHYVDERPNAGLNYYRLKQIDIDGEFQYSNLITVETDQSSRRLRLFPNPAHDRMWLSLDSESTETILLRIYDLRGHQLFQRTFASAVSMDQQMIDLAPYPAGMYLVEVRLGKQVWREKVVKK